MGLGCMVVLVGRMAARVAIIQNRDGVHAVLHVPIHPAVEIAPVPLPGYLHQRRYDAGILNQGIGSFPREIRHAGSARSLFIDSDPVDGHG